MIFGTTLLYIQTGGFCYERYGKIVQQLFVHAKKLSQATPDATQQFESFESVFENDPNQVYLLITALIYRGYFYPGPAPLYERTIVESNPDLCNSINHYLNMNSKDLLSNLFSQFLLCQDSNVIYRCWVINNRQLFSKDILLNSEFYSDIRQLLNKIESVQNTGKSGQSFWNDDKFSELVDAIESLKQLKPQAAPQIQDYTAILLNTNLIEQIYEMKDQQVKPVFENDSAASRYFIPLESSSSKHFFAKMIIIPPMQKLEANTDNAIKHLFYLTNGDKNTFDNLAKDFICLATQSPFKQRNTIVNGDIDKLGKWLSLIYAISQYVSFMAREPYTLPLNFPYSREYYMEHTPLLREKPQHFYCLCNKNIQYPDPGNKHIHLNFPYGGKFYELTTLTPNEFIWIAELLFAHGWHLINGAQGSRKAKTRNIEKEFTGFIKKCDENNEIRIPAALVYQLYTAYAKKEKQTKEVSDSELYKLIQGNDIEYGTFKSRDVDINYINNELKTIMVKTGIVFEDKWTKKGSNHKSFKCTINNELWKTLTAPSPESEHSDDEEKFGKYLKELFSRYEYIFKYEVPEFFNNGNNSENSMGSFEPVGTRYIK